MYIANLTLNFFEKIAKKIFNSRNCRFFGECKIWLKK